MSGTEAGGLVIGIDPGLGGAIAVISPKESNPAKKVVAIHDMPTIEFKSHTNKRVDLYKLATILRPYKDDAYLCVIEDVASSPQMGLASSFNFGYSSGALAGVVAAFEIPMYFIKPSVWKQIMMLDRDKNSSREKAQTLYPEYSHVFDRKKDDGRAEALLIATVGQRL